MLFFFCFVFFFQIFVIRVHRLSQGFKIAGYRGRRQAKSAVTDDEPGSKPSPFYELFAYQKSLETAFLIATGIDCHELSG